MRQATYGTIKFGTYYTLKKLANERGLLINEDGSERVWSNILCAAAAGAISSAIANPTDVLKVRMQVHGKDSTRACWAASVRSTNTRAFVDCGVVWVRRLSVP